MAETIILIRRSGISGSVPPSGSLAIGELALNTTTGLVFYHDTGSDSVELIRAGSASFAETASFALNAASSTGSFTGTFTGAFQGDGAQITGIVSAAFASFATSASFAETASFALNAGAGADGGGETSSFVTLTFGTAVREIVQLTSSVISSGSRETGSINLGRTFVLHRISGSAETRVRVYSSASFRDSDLTRAIGTDPTGEHGVIVDAVLSGSPNFFVLDLAPYVIGADSKTTPDGVVAYTLDDLSGAAVTHSLEFTRLEFEAQNTGTILDRDNVTLDTAILTSGSTETGSVELGLAFNLLEVSASSDSRIRLYTTPGFRNADLSRGVGVDPTGEHGVILDLVVTGTFHDWQLAPLVLGASLETPATEAIAYAVQNRTAAGISVSVDFTRIRIENQPVITTTGSGGGGGAPVFGGDFSGSFSGSVTGALTGTFTGPATGTLLGSVTGNLLGTASLATDAVNALSAETASFLLPVGFSGFKPILTVADTNPYTVVPQDHTLLIDATSGSAAIAVQLPAVALFMSGAAARIIHVVKASGSNNVEILPSGSETVMLDVSASLTDVQQGLTLQPSGSNWWAI